MNHLKFQHFYQEWVSTIFGTVILVMSCLYFWNNLDNITLSQLGILLVMGAIGILFLFVKINSILKYLPGGNQEIEPKEDIPK